jgi:hypothetical protein
MQKYYIYIFIFINFLQVVQAQPVQFDNFDYQDNNNDSLISLPDTISNEVKIVEWKYNKYYHQREYSSMDTVLKRIHIFHPVIQKATTYAWLGNVGQAAFSNSYFENIDNTTGNIFMNPYSFYFTNFESTSFYNTTRPFSYISYTQGGGDFQNVNFFHTQNVRKDFNFGGRLNYIDSKGQYLYQRSNINGFQAFANYDGLRYNTHIVFNYTIINTQELEGIIEDSTILKRNVSDIPKNEFYTNGDNSMKVNDATHNMLKLNFVMRQEKNLNRPHPVTDSSLVGNLPYKNSIGHSLVFDKSERFFTDKFINDSLFPIQYFDTLETKDFARSWDLENLFFYKHTKSLDYNTNISFQFDYGILYNKFIYNYIYWDSVENQNFNHFTAFRLFGKYKSKFSYGFFVKYHHKGREKNNMLINAYLQKELKFLNTSNILKLSFDEKSETPSYFYNNYSSNYYYWRNDFKSQKSSLISLLFQEKESRYKIQVDAKRITDYIYINSKAYPEQWNEAISVLSLSLNKTTQLWNVFVENKVVLQKSSSQNIMPLPDFLTYNSIYYKNKLFNKVLELAVGTEVWYTSAYYTPSFNYATGLFQMQNEKKIGDYPFIDVFLNLKFKRVKTFLKYSHLNYHFMNKGFFTVMNYPMYRSNLVFGLSWNFYN